MITCFGGLAAENVSGMKGRCFTSLRSSHTRLKTSLFEISYSEYRDAAVPWYWKPNVSQACSGWILLFIQSNTTASPLVCFCLRLAIRASSSGIWLSSTSFSFHSGCRTGGPGVITGRVSDWFSMYNHLGFQSITFYTKFIGDVHFLLPLSKLKARTTYVGAYQRHLAMTPADATLGRQYFMNHE